MMNNNKAMSIIEYSLLLVIVIAALFSMGAYLKRSVSGRWRQSADTFGSGRQYNSSAMQIW
jgi:Flp pilus assembly pilin Flp